jgi:Carboxypeptidase regulatory-like domain
MRNVIFLLVCAFLGTAFASGPEMTNIEVMVTNQNGKPVEGASVIVKFVEGRSKIKFGAKIRTEWDLKTTQEGNVKVPSIPQGKILIQVIAKNYQTYGETFDVEQEEKTIEVKLLPPQPQYTSHPK